jgi:hypothetical protein
MKLKLLEESTVKWFENIGVIMRIFSFGMLAILGKDTPLLTMWIINTIDAMILTWAAWERSNRAYIILNIFWLIVGVIGIWNSYHALHSITHP